MSDFMPCSAAPKINCPTIFGLSVSGWIDERNIGDIAETLQTRPPAGLRLRWNCPFLGADPAGRTGYPTLFHVLRTDDISNRQLVYREPNAGHVSRITAPAQLWRRVSPTGAEAYVGPDPCDRADAVYFELNPFATPVEAMLVDTSGQRSVAIDLQPGDRFYFEMANLHGVVFSSQPNLTGPVEFLDLRSDFGQLDIGAKVIATIDARAWVQAPFDRVVRRIANQGDEPFVTIAPNDWKALVPRGEKVIALHDRGQPVAQEELDMIAMAAAARWEAATLMGWGFVDGEHPPTPSLDRIDFAAMMLAGSKGIFGYQIVAEFPGNEQGVIAKVGSTLQFVSTAPEGALTAVAIRGIDPPRALVQVVNTIKPGMVPDKPMKTSPNVEQVFCRSGYLFTTTNFDDERILVTPMASASAISGEVFQSGGVLEHGAGDPVIRIAGMERRITRWFNYRVPFVDSTVWLDVTVGDHWDRRVKLLPTSPRGMDLNYEGTAPPLSQAICDAAAGLVEAAINPGPPWKADLLAVLTRGSVEVMARNPATTRLEIVLKAGPAFLSAGQRWGAVVYPAPNQADRDNLVGGIFEVGAFAATIIGFATTPRGQTICEFDADPQCAGEQLYPTQYGTAEADLREAEDAPRLWSAIGDIKLDNVGSPTKNSVFGLISAFADPTSSTTFWFSTRMVVTIAGQLYRGPLSTPVPAPFIHPAPLPPDFCFDVQQLGTDFYGRALVKVSTINCHRFNPDLRVSLAGSEGRAPKPADFSSLKGIFRPQKPINDTTVFECFDALARTPEGEPFTLAISYVRESDDVESTSRLQEIVARAKGN